MEDKALIDTLAEGLARAEVKTLYDSLLKVEFYGEAGQNTRAQASRVVKKVDKLGETLAKEKAERLVDILYKHTKVGGQDTCAHTD